MNLRLDNTLLAVQRFSLGMAFSLLAVTVSLGGFIYCACYGISLIGD